MARSQVKLDSAGIAAELKSPAMQRAIRLKTEQVARGVKSMGIRVSGLKGEPGEMDLPVEVYLGTSDRARGTVVLEHPAGEAVQAKHGALTKAAAQAGLEVRSK